MRWIILAAALAMAATCASQAARAETTGEGGETTPTLQELLEKGLCVRQPSETAFVKKVAERVEAGTLSRELVDSTFLWARTKKPYPFPYFERALKFRARSQGVPL